MPASNVVGRRHGLEATSALPRTVLIAESLGITSVPALALDGQVFHINFGASLSDLS